MSDDSMALGYALGQDSNNGGGNDGMWGGMPRNPRSRFEG